MEEAEDHLAEALAKEVRLNNVTRELEEEVALLKEERAELKRDLQTAQDFRLATHERHDLEVQALKREMDLKVEGAKMKGMLNVLNKTDVSSTPESSKSPDNSLNVS